MLYRHPLQAQQAAVQHPGEGWEAGDRAALSAQLALGLGVPLRKAGIIVAISQAHAEELR